MKEKMLAKAKLIVLFAAVIAVSFSIFFFTITKAQVPSGVPFSGPILSFVSPTPVCPVPHTLIFNFNTMTPMAIAVVPGSQLYAKGNLATVGNFVLGTSLPTPIPCLLPYLIMPISQVGTT